MPILNLGVVDIPYNAEGGQTTGSVAEILEAKYGVMEKFVEVHAKDIAKALEDGLEGAMENLLLGGPTGADPFATGTSEIETQFKAFLSNQEMDALGVPGVPTRASLKGVSKRFKQKQSIARGPRPSFIDTGLYEANFKAWVE